MGEEPEKEEDAVEDEELRGPTALPFVIKAPRGPIGRGWCLSVTVGADAMGRDGMFELGRNAAAVTAEGEDKKASRC